MPPRITTRLLDLNTARAVPFTFHSWGEASSGAR